MSNSFNSIQVFSDITPLIAVRTGAPARARRGNQPMHG